MVITVNTQKFACESCIKGHRSSSCHHTDRPLYEVKKKGRPVSQCEKCRALRKSKKVHSKCNCNDSPAAGPSTAPAQRPVPGAKVRRFVPIAPALPNGIKDAMAHARAVPVLPPDKRQMVETLLNPCRCTSVWKCQCRHQPDFTASSEDCCSALDALADAAVLCGENLSKVMTEKHSSSRPSSPGRHKRTKHLCNTEEDSYPSIIDLPPLVLASASIPDFPLMPPLSTFTSLAGTGCTCGLQCACPGCVEHRGSEHASEHHHDCAGGACLYCVDRQSDATMFLPGTDTGSSMVNIFLARAAALPAPPSLRGNTSTLVTIPKLECCGGRCRCPGGSCGCGQSCDGCCEHHLTELPSSQNQLLPATSGPQAQPSKSCCSGRAAAS